MTHLSVMLPKLVIWVKRALGGIWTRDLCLTKATLWPG